MKERVCRVPDITRKQWLEFRRSGIGGSDASTIVGLNPYSSLYYLYCDKLGQLPEKEDSEAMRQGRDLEQYVADRWMEATGKRCQRNNYMWRSIEHPFALADIDREVVGENAGLECKTTSVYNRHDFEAGDIPPNYYVQCQHYMAVMGFDRMYLAVLVLNRGFYTYEIPRDEDEISVLMDAEQAFWEGHILPQVPPDLNGSEADLDALRKKYPEDSGENLFPFELTRQNKADLESLASLNQEIEALQQAADACRARIMEQMGERSTAMAPGWTVSWKMQQRTSLDSKALKKDYPDIYAEYAKTTTSRVFRVKRTEE